MTATLTTTPAKRLSVKQRAFLAAYAKCGNLTAAAELAKTSRRNHYDWLAKDEYRAAFDAAHEEACDVLETEARRRAVEGTERPVYQGGKQVGKVREFSDVLLIFLLKGARPEKYRERQAIEHAGPGGGPIRAEAELSDEQLLKIAALANPEQPLEIPVFVHDAPR